jgi:hypothetical protein
MRELDLAGARPAPFARAEVRGPADLGVGCELGRGSDGPKHVVRRGKTSVRTEEQARRLLESVDTSTLVGLRCPAVILRTKLIVSRGADNPPASIYADILRGGSTSSGNGQT